MKKRILSLALALFLLVSLTTNAFAATTQTITMQNTPSVTGLSIQGVKFEVYKVMELTSTGTYVPTANFEDFFAGQSSPTDYLATTGIGKLLYNHIINGEFTFDLQTDSVVTMTGSATSEAVQFDVEKGVYFIVNLEGQSSEPGIMASGSLISVVDQNLTLNFKGSAPKVDKEIMHNDLNNGKGAWDEVADHQIGDTVEFRISSTIPSTIAGYDNYTYILTDTMSSGVTYNRDVAVYLDKEMQQEVPIDYYDVDYPGNGETFVITVDVMNFIKHYPMVETIYTGYTGILNEDALVAPGYEENEITLKYSNNPYDTSTSETSDYTTNLYL